MAKGRYTRLHGRKMSTFMLVLSTLFMLSVVLLMLLALGILSLPMSSDDSPPNDLSGFRRRIVERYAFRNEFAISWILICFEVMTIRFLNDRDFDYFFYFFKFFAAEAMDWGREGSSGLKFSLGSQELSYITIS